MRLPAPTAEPQLTGTGPLDDPRDLTAEQTAQFLRLALSGSRPIDHLLRRLEDADGPEWFARALPSSPVGSIPDGCRKLAEGPVEITELDLIKRRSKALSMHATYHEEMLAGVAGYFLAVAAGVVHLRRLLSSRPVEELEPIFRDLAALVPEPWATLVKSAADGINRGGGTG